MSESEEMKKLMKAYDEVAKKAAEKIVSEVRTGPPLPFNFFVSWWAKIPTIAITFLTIMQIADLILQWTHPR
jgi:hypothetical protein